jgi:hypothetical protein
VQGALIETMPCSLHLTTNLLTKNTTGAPNKHFQKHEAYTTQGEVVKDWNCYKGTSAISNSKEDILWPEITLFIS